MCLIVVAYRVSEHYALALAANRDELHDRPSAPAGWWPDQPHVLGGRDLVAGGSWLAISRSGRLAAVTNYAEPSSAAAVLSRGLIVRDFVASAETTGASIARAAPSYGPFNALLLAQGELRYLSNRGATARLAPGIHSLSNGALGADWPKLHRAERGMAASLGAADPHAALLELLGERVAHAAGREAYRQSPFITGHAYGTRASTIVLIDFSGRVTFYERRFGRDGVPVGEGRYEFTVAPAALGLAKVRSGG